jgi:hypothetical protein
VRGDLAVYERSLTKDKPLHELELVVIAIANEKHQISSVIADNLPQVASPISGFLKFMMSTD